MASHGVDDGTKADLLLTLRACPGLTAAALADEIKRAQAADDPDTGETYYLHWLNTLEKLVADKGVTTQDALHRYRHAWEHACDRTPHGQPIELRDEDFR